MADEKNNDKDELQIEEGVENPERGNWSGQLDFLLSCLGYAVGLGNVWRFPYLCYKHGGGAFLIPYTLMLLCIGVPCFFLEISTGQYAGLGPVTLYSNLSPLFKGLGFANFLASACVGLYYNMIIAWTIYYLFASFTTHLPWSDCNNDYNSEFCFSITDYKDCLVRRENGSNVVYHMGRCLSSDEDMETLMSNLTHFYACEREIKHFIDPDDPCKGVNHTEKADGIAINDKECVDLDRVGEIKVPFDIPPTTRKTAAQEYLTNQVLAESSGLEEMGGLQWKLTLCLFAAWVVIFLCLIKGIQSSGKVVYFTATFPYFVLVILFFRAITLEGAGRGIEFYIVPKWDKLTDISVWEGAAVQIFFSLSVAGGGLITLASYNKFHNNVLRDTMIVCFGNCATSVFAGFAIFSVLGFLATELEVEVDQVVESGAGLAFIAYPDLVTRLPWSPLWSILFFSMLFTLGLDSQFAITETVLTGILDFKPELRKKKTMVVGIICVVLFILGIPLTMQGGGYLVDLLDYYAAGWPYLFIGLTELVIVAHVYGIQNFLDDLHHMIGFNPGQWAKTHLMFVYMTLSPLIIFVILIYSWASYKPMTKGSYEYPLWANLLGWAIAMTAILAMPVVAVYQVISKVFGEYGDLDKYEAFIRTMDDLLHHTPEWRQNANRARARADASARAQNGAKANVNLNGFDNLAMENEESSSKL